MNRIGGFTLLLLCLFCFPSLLQGQTLNRAPAPAEKEAPQAPVLPKAKPLPAAPVLENDAVEAPGKSSSALQKKPLGKLTKQGDRLFFRLDRPIAKMDVYAGKRKLGQ